MTTSCDEQPFLQSWNNGELFSSHMPVTIAVSSGDRNLTGGRASIHDMSVVAMAVELTACHFDDRAYAALSASSRWTASGCMEINLSANGICLMPSIV